MKRPSSQILLVLIALSFLASGLVEPSLGPGSDLEIAIAMGHSLLLAVLTFFWCKADIAQGGHKVRPSTPYSVVVLSVLGVLLYLLQSRPGRGALLSTLKMILFILLCMGLQSLGAAS